MTPKQSLIKIQSKNSSRTKSVATKNLKDKQEKPYRTSIIPPRPKLPFPIINLQNHFERTCDLWTLKEPTFKQRIARSAIFVFALLTTIYWPINSLLSNFIILLLGWIYLGFSSAKMPRYILMLNLMLNLTFLYQIIKLITGT